MIRFDYIMLFKWIGSTTNEVYSHCNAGVGRSVAAACGYLTYALGQVDDEIVVTFPGYLHQKRKILLLGGGFKHFLCSPLFGEDSQFD